ncbi:hypothetical protein BDP27DRAFT_1431231 [Rhodocollybia butyracea]|uniref:Uncharacterized protein n=1 Tax=Rhodocollybia butyracea TaxID=206335 RepID=A0A9P5TXJ1_9AGAR|nr:hypothetical protein BDP27DRAFT_1431231 [Rhodocollybia butyracea]
MVVVPYSDLGREGLVAEMFGDFTGPQSSFQMLVLAFVQVVDVFGRMFYNEALFFSISRSMAPPFLESYCYLSEPGHGTITLPRETPIVDDPDRRQILEITNALAFLCVQEPQSEVYAVALRLTGEPLTIYIAENNEVPEKTKDHLENLLSKLSQIRCR